MARADAEPPGRAGPRSGEAERSWRGPAVINRGCRGRAGAAIAGADRPPLPMAARRDGVGGRRAAALRAPDARRRDSGVRAAGT